MSSKKSKQPPVILITGASGSGKSSVMDNLLKRKLKIVKFVTYTTRPKRPGERHGRDYWFVTVPQFKKMLAKKEFYEWAEVYDHYYGSSKKEMARLLKGKKSIVFIIDAQGARTFQEIMPGVITIFLDTPMKSLKERLKKRGTKIYDLKRRISELVKENRFRKRANYVVPNLDNKLNQAVNNVAIIIRGLTRRA